MKMRVVCLEAEGEAGQPIANQQATRGRLDARRIHVMDFYHFDVARQSDVTLHLRTGSQFELRLLADNGHLLDSSSSYIRHGLSPGQYFVARLHGRDVAAISSIAGDDTTRATWNRTSG